MKFEIMNEDNHRNIVIEKESETDGILYIHIKMTQFKPDIPKLFSLLWKFPVKDCYSVWTPDGRRRELGPNWAKRKTESRLASWMPLHSIVSLCGKNRMAIAVSDAMTPITIATGVCEEDSCLDCRIDFFTKPVAPVKEYSATVRIDLRDVAYYDSIYDIVAWWENSCGYTPAYVPEQAKLPVNSLWYSYHQDLDVEDIIKECKLSKEMGMDTVIVDDGWQTDDNNRGYAFCGDWEVAKSKIPDMKDFVKRVHETGMKIMLWYSVPFVGIYSKNYDRFKDMLLDGSGNRKTFWSLDPRYQEVRDFLVGHYKKALAEWQLDGLKLDFIDQFVLSGKSLEYDARRDYSSLEDAIDVLISDVTKALKEIKPDVLIEFRQGYVGPAIRRYGNMFRIGDCPDDAIMNRAGVVNLRLTSGGSAVHSDMLMWNYEEPVESASVQLASVLYAVPQISMKIQRLNETHRKMLKYYLEFWRQNREILLNGKILAANPESFYSIVCARKDEKAIYTVYTDCLIEGNAEKEIVAVNASKHEELILKNLKSRSYKVVNCMGEELERGCLNGDFAAVKVPLGGMLFIQ